MAATIVFDKWDGEKIRSNLLQRFKRIYRFDGIMNIYIYVCCTSARYETDNVSFKREEIKKEEVKRMELAAILIIGKSCRAGGWKYSIVRQREIVETRQL